VKEVSKLQIQIVNLGLIYSRRFRMRRSSAALSALPSNIGADFFRHVTAPSADRDTLSRRAYVHRGASPIRFRVGDRDLPTRFERQSVELKDGVHRAADLVPAGGRFIANSDLAAIA
jgi:hypothetical protein